VEFQKQRKSVKRYGLIEEESGALFGSETGAI